MTQTWDPANSDLYQWWRGSKLCIGPCESIITFEEEDQSCIEIRVRGPRGTSAQCFALLSIIFDAIDTTMELVAPGMLLEKHWLSPSQLREYDEVSYHRFNSKIVWLKYILFPINVVYFRRLYILGNPRR